MYIVLIILLAIFSLGLIGVVLIQSGKGGGLSGAFGLGEGQAVFGSRAGDVLTKATEIFAIGFMVLCIAVTWQSKMADDSIVAGNKSVRQSVQSSTPRMTMEEAEAQARLTNQIPQETGLSNGIAPVLETDAAETDPGVDTENTPSQ